MALETGARLGPYEIVSIIGAGGMGEVYKARDTRLDRMVAVKIIRGIFGPEDVRRFEQEARLVAQINQPNVLVLHDFGIHEGAPYMVSEFIEGESLRALVARGPIASRRVIDIAKDIAQGLAAAHDRGIVHRDLKPENILITKSGRAKILDFGIAKAKRTLGANSEDSPTAPLQTEPGHLLGTIGYVSPEQVRGGEADSRSDIFALGAIVHEMLSGRRAFIRGSAVESLNAILKDEPVELSELGIVVPESLNRAMRRCLEKEPTRRFQSTDDLAFTLETMDTLSPKEKNVAADLVRPRTRIKGAVGAAALVLAAFVVGWWWPKTSAPPSTFEFRRLTFQPGVINAARFAPDGETIVYDGRFDDGLGGVYTTHAGSREFRSLDLPPGTTLLAVSSTGDLAVRLPDPKTGGVLARVPLAGGVPRPLVEGVLGADWSPDGKDLAIVRRVPGGSRLEYPIGKSLVEVKLPNRIARARVSPDGDRVAYVEYLPGPNSTGHISLVDRKGSMKVLSTDWSGNAGPVWSEDGKEIYFSGTNATGSNPQIEGRYVNWGPPAARAVDMAGNERLVLKSFVEIGLHDVRKGQLLLIETVSSQMVLAFQSATDTNGRDLAWLNWSVPATLSSDGKLVLFDETRAGEGMDSVYLRRTDGTPPIRLGNGQAMALSDDGAWAATVATKSGPSPIVLMPTGAGEVRALKGGDLICLDAHFFPGGERLLLRAAEPGHNPRLYVQGIGDAKAKPLSPEGVTGLALSPDGTHAATVLPDGHAMSYPTNGGDGSPLRGFVAGDQPIQWSADGKSLFASHVANRRFEVYRIALESGKRELWRSYPATDALSAVTRVLVTPDGRSSLAASSRYWYEVDVVSGVH